MPVKTVEKLKSECSLLVENSITILLVPVMVLTVLEVLFLLGGATIDENDRGPIVRARD